MTDRTIFDPDELLSLENAIADGVAGVGWTNLQTVRIGAEISGAQLVKADPQSDDTAPTRGEFYYTTLDDRMVGRSINSGTIKMRYGHLAVIGHPPDDKNRYHFMRQVNESERRASTTQAGVADHSDQHTLRNVDHNGERYDGIAGEDPTTPDLRQIWNLNIQTESGLSVKLTDGFLIFDGVLVYYPGEVKDLTASMPATAGQARYALLEVDSAGTLQTTLGSTFAYAAPAAALYTYVPAATAGRYVVGAVCLRNGDTEFSWAHFWPVSSHGAVYNPSSGGTVEPGTFEARLSLTSGTPVTTSDVTAATDVYLSAYKGELLSLYDGSAAWEYVNLNSVIDIPVTDTQNGDTTNGSAVISGLTDTSQMIAGMEVTGAGIAANSVISTVDSATQVTLNNNATATATVAITFKIPADTIVDIFVINNSGTAALRYGPLWSNSGAGTSARATALTKQDGVYVLTGSTTYRYAGTIMTTGTAGQVNDSDDWRGVWNYYNRVGRLLYLLGSGSHTYATAAYRYWNNDSSLLIKLVVGVVEDTIIDTISGNITPTSNLGQIAISHQGFATQLSFWGHAVNNETITTGGTNAFLPDLGYNELRMSEFSSGTNTTFTFCIMTGELEG